MQFDKTMVIDAVKNMLSASEKAKKNDIEFALSLCLDDLSLRLKSDGFLSSYTKTTSDQELVLKGDNMNLNSIYAIVISSGSTKRTLQYLDQKKFLRDYESNSSNLTAGVPEYWTQLASDDGGFPKIKFERPLSAEATLTIYFFEDVTPDNITRGRAVSPIVNGTLGYFFGINSTKGMGYYQVFEHMVPLMKASDKFNADPESSFELNKLDITVKGIQRNFRGRRG